MNVRSGIVLGGSSGVGLAVAERLAGDGCEVHVLSRRGLRGDAGRSPRVRAAVADIRDYASLSAAVATIGRHGPVDFVVNCVGIGYLAPIGADHSAEWADILATNVVGLLNLLSAIDVHLPDLPQFVHVSSLAAHQVSRVAGNLCYSVSKAAARTIVQEHLKAVRAAGRRTRVTMVSPGFIEGTEFEQRFYSRTAKPASSGSLFAGQENLTPANVATIIVDVLRQPDHVELVDVLVRPRGQQP